MHTTVYMPFTRKRRLFKKKSEPIGGGRPTAPFESVTDTVRETTIHQTPVSPTDYFVLMRCRQGRRQVKNGWVHGRTSERKTQANNGDPGVEP